MIKTFEATVDEQGNIRVLAPVQLLAGQRVLVTILDEPAAVLHEAALLGQGALDDWNRREEDEAWAHLQPEK